MKDRISSWSQRILYIAESLEDDPGGDEDMSTPLEYDMANYTEDGARTKFDWGTITPFELVHDNERLDQETTRSDSYRTRLWNGQGLADI